MYQHVCGDAKLIIEVEVNKTNQLPCMVIAQSVDWLGRQMLSYYYLSELCRS